MQIKFRSSSTIDLPLKAACSFFVLAMVTTSCIDASSKVVVNEDGTGTIAITRTIDTQFADNFVSDNGSRFSPSATDINRFCEQISDPDTYPSYTAVQRIERTSSCGATITADVGPDDSFSERLAELDQQSFGPISPLFTAPLAEEYIVAEVDGQWVLKIPAPSISRLDTDLITPEDAQSMLASSDITYEVSLPGNPIVNENNADSVNGGTFVWVVDPSNPPIVLEAKTEPDPPNWFQRYGLLAGTVLGGVALLSAAGWLTMKLRNRRRKKRSEKKSLSPRPPAKSKSTAGSHATSSGDEGIEKSQNQKDDSEADTEEHRPTCPDLKTLPLGASKPRWDEDHDMWRSDHNTKGAYFFDERADRWEPLR